MKSIFTLALLVLVASTIVYSLSGDSEKCDEFSQGDEECRLCCVRLNLVPSTIVDGDSLAVNHNCSCEQSEINWGNCMDKIEDKIQCEQCCADYRTGRAEFFKGRYCNCVDDDD